MNFDDIMRAVKVAAALYQTTPTMILSKCRDCATSDARFIVYRLLRDEGMTSTAIGEALNRDHASVLHGLKRAGELVEIDRKFAAKLDAARLAFLALAPA